MAYRAPARLVLDDIWESVVEALVPGPPVSMLCTSRRHTLSVDLAGSFDAAQETGSALHGAGQSAARSEGCMLIS